MKEGQQIFKNYILKPEQCALISCIPQTQFDFEKQRNSDKHEFARFHAQSWSKYQYEIVNTITEIYPKIKKTGTKIYENASFSTLASLYTKDVKLIMIVAHHGNNLVEFFDGFFSITEIVDKIPADYEGIFDLCVCNPLKLVELIDMTFPKILVRFTNTKSSITYWLYYYFLLMEYIKQTDSDFFDAYQTVTNIFHELKKQQ